VRTSPAVGEPVSFSVAFGSCARYARDSEQPIWNAVRSHAPDVFLWLGDNIYGDTLNPAALAEEYRRQRDVSTFRPFGRSVPQLAIWDDHDYGLNNHDRSNPIRDGALAAFRTYWANPSYGLTDVPGVFFRYRYGAVDFFMLDGRYYRDANDAPDVPGKTMLGAAQLAWLKQELAGSNAVFKVLACGSGWSKAKGPGGDSWSAFLHERNALFDFIRERKIGGVVLLSGDTHVGELNAIPWSERGGYDFYDLVSSPLAQECGDEWPNRSPEITIRRVHARSANFGLLRFELEGEPRLSYQLMDVDGKPAWSALELTARQLRNGQTSWREAIDPTLTLSLRERVG
jgi:alkaline phosphatase D